MSDTPENKTVNLPDTEEGRQEEAAEPLKVRTHRALQDLGRTDSKKQGIVGVDLSRQNLYKDTAQARALIRTGQTQIIFERPTAQMKIEAQTDMVLNFLLANIPEKDTYEPDKVATATSTLDEYMALRGLRDRKEARQAVKSEISTLLGISITQEDDEVFIGVPLAGDVGYIDRSGNIVFSFSPTFRKLYLSSRSAYTLELDRSAFKINIKRNPHSWSIYKKLLNHYNANMGRKNEYRLSVSALLDYVVTIPKPEDVPNRKTTEKIIGVMERDLNALVTLGVIEEWDYCHSKGEPLTPEEQAMRITDTDKDKTMPYAIAKDLLITWKFANEYNRAAHLEAKERASQRRIQAHEDRERQEKNRARRIQRKAESKAAESLAEELKAKILEGKQS